MKSNNQLLVRALAHIYTVVHKNNTRIVEVEHFKAI